MPNSLGSVEKEGPLDNKQDNEIKIITENSNDHQGFEQKLKELTKSKSSPERNSKVKIRDETASPNSEQMYSVLSSPGAQIDAQRAKLARANMSGEVEASKNVIIAQAVSLKVSSPASPKKMIENEMKTNEDK
jgi:hypothetical protein